MSSSQKNKNTSRSRKGKQAASGSQNPPFVPPRFEQPHFVPHPFGQPQFIPPPMDHEQRQAYYREQQRLSQEFFSPQGYVPSFENMEPVNAPDDEEDEVEETAPQQQDFTPLSDDEVQEIAPKKSTRAKPIAWTEEEEEDLTMSYIDCTEDKLRGNEQTFKSYWLRVTKNFNERSRRGIERTNHQVYSKWGDINKYCGWFNGFFLTQKSSNPSGANKADLIRRAHSDYVKIAGRNFRQERCWEIVRDHPKWEPIPHMNANPPKRTKTSESNTYTTSSEAQFSPGQNEELDLSPPPVRRKGKKAAASASSATGDKEEILQHFEQFSKMSVETKEKYRETKLKLAERNKEMIEELHAEQMRLNAEQLRHIKKKEHDKDFDRFIAPHDHLTGTALEMVLNYKKELAERWGWNFP